MSKLLIEDNPLQVLPKLAEKIGLNEAIVLQQIHYWIKNKKNKGYEHNGYKWVYNTYTEWQEDNFPFWSVRTVQRIFLKLEEMNLIISERFDAQGYDQKKYYRINHEKLKELENKRQDGTPDDDKVAHSGTTKRHNVNKESEITSETTSEIKEYGGEKTPPRARDKILETLREAEKEYNKPKKDLDLVDGILHFEEEYIDRKEKLGIVLDNLYDYPSDIQEVIKAFCNKWKKPPPPKKAKTFAKWIKDAREVKIMCQNARLSPYEVFDEAYYIWKTPKGNVSRKEYDGSFNVYDIGSVISLTWESIGNILNGTPKRKVRMFTDASGKQIEKEIE